MGLPFAKWDWWPNTLNAHRLCNYLAELDSKRSELAEQERLDRGLQLIQKFYELTYERGVNISTPEGAAQALGELGFAAAEDAAKWLKEGCGLDQVLADDAHAKREMDIDGVPFFVISEEEGKTRPLGLSGAQPSSAFSKAFKKVAG
uniref:DSBA-like thioredoxin domain-containing protein n=1 Tax=Alexandrium catenella TaxID=2925 RepID=A0A7S1W8F9_ALECA